MNENEKLILKNLIIGKEFENFDDMLKYLLRREHFFNHELLEIVFKETLASLKGDEKIVIRYQIILNAIIISNNRDKMARKYPLALSIYELIRRLAYVFQDNIYKYLSGVLKVKVGIVEVNKKGLKIKHFAYDNTYKVDDLVYIGNLTPDNIFLVSDFYEVELKNLFSYILHVSSVRTYHFDIGFEEIAKQSIDKLNERRVCKVKIIDISFLLYIDIDFYNGMEVECSVKNVLYIGIIEEEIYYYQKDDIDGNVIRMISSEVPKIYKERRSMNNDVANYFGYPLDDFYIFLKDSSNKNKQKVFSMLDNIFPLLASTKKINTIEAVNLYYRPLINYLLKLYNPNEYYLHNDRYCVSLLSYLVNLERIRNNILKFLIDDDLLYRINTVSINVNGRIKHYLAYNYQYKVGEPVFIYLDSQYSIGFVHQITSVILNEMPGKLAYFESANITRIMNLRETILKKTQIEDFHIVILVKEDKEVKYVIIKNYVPYVGEVLNVKGKSYLIIEEPKVIEKDAFDFTNVEVIEM